MHRSKTVELYLYFKNIEDLNLHGGTTIDCLTDIQGEKLRIDFSGGSSGTLRLNYEDILCKSSGGAKLDMMGKAENFTLNSSSGSSVNAKEIIAKQCIIDGSSGANVQVSAADQI